MKFLAPFVFVLSLLGASQVIWELAVVSMLASAREQETFISGDHSRLITSPLASQLNMLHSKWKSLSTFADSLPGIKHQLGRATLALSVIQTSYDKKLEYYCTALGYFRQAAARSPHNARHQIAWADISSQLKSETVCSSAVNEKDFTPSLSPQARLELARSLAPYSVSDLYLAALVYLALGEKSPALELLKLNQEINPHYTKQQREYTYSLVTSEQELRQAMPQQYPEALAWIWYFSVNREHDYLSWKATFVELLDGTIAEVRHRFEQGKITQELFAQFIKNINEVPLVSGSEKLRKRLDELLSHIYRIEDNTWWADILQQRQTLHRIPVLKSVIVDDKQPRQTMLFGWVPDSEPRTAALDAFGRSLGFYLPRGQFLSLLILQSLSSTARLSARDIQVMWSEDNLSYHPLDTQKLELGMVDGKETIVISVHNPNTRYLKIRYLGANQTPRFTNRFGELVQAYGEVL